MFFANNKEKNRSRSGQREVFLMQKLRKHAVQNSHVFLKRILVVIYVSTHSPEFRGYQSVIESITH